MLLWILEKEGIFSTYNDVIKVMYDIVVLELQLFA